DDPSRVPDYLHRLCIQLDAYYPTMTGEALMQVAWARVYQWNPNATPPSIQPPAIVDGGIYRISPYLATHRCLEVPLDQYAD
nr:hypothetical protein [Shewanella shenzhenensis]